MDLKDHMIRIHKTSYEVASKARSIFGLKKERVGKRIRKRVPCSMDGCLAVAARIHNHLRDTHKLTGRKYKEALMKTS